MNSIVVLLLVVLAVVAAGLVAWAIVHLRYVKSLEAKGWRYEGNPSISVAHGLNVSPFGLGFERKVERAVHGSNADGVPFIAFEYRSSAWRGAGYVLTLPLPHSLPPAAVSAESGIGTPAGPEYAAELAACLTPARGFEVTVDHARLVLLNAPTDADGLERALQALTAARAALLASPAMRRQGPPPPPGLSFVGHPDWSYQPRGDELLRQLRHTGGGSNHEAHDIILSQNQGLPFLRLRHTWQTTHTTTDSEGRSHTTTTNHEEILCEFRTTFPFLELSANWGWFGRTQRFEWEEFNDRFRIEAADRRLAHAVLHQRQMEYLMEVNAPKFAISADGSIELGEGGRWLPADIERADGFLRGFFSRVPNHVWQDLGAWPRPIPELESDPA